MPRWQSRGDWMEEHGSRYDAVFLVGGNRWQLSHWRTERRKMKRKHTKRGGSASWLKRHLKKLARKTVVRRWLLLAVVKIVGWFVKRLWFDGNHHDLSS
jgi:hypothetical protein